MSNFYSRWIGRWEAELASKDSNRIVRPLEWGTEWIPGFESNGNVAGSVRKHLERAVEHSDEFFSYDTPSDFELAGSKLTFTSAVSSPYPENNKVHAEYFPVEGRTDRAVVVLPQWNSDSLGHLGLCKLLNRFGVPALRMSMAYHDHRMPPELDRADYHVSANIGRTVHASRQSIIDVRCCLDWLESRGYQRLGILGTSLGSCMAFITAAHDDRIRAGVFNHVSMHFSDVVWTGLATQHVRKGFADQITQEDLRSLWAVISPATFMDRLEKRKLQSLLVWAPYDTTFLPEFSRQVLEEFKRRKMDHKVLRLPCAHYTTGRFPFNWMDGLGMCRFLSKRL